MEYFKNGLKGMTLVDLIEMLCDWKAASLRNKGGDIRKILSILIQRHADKFGYAPLDIFKVLENTIAEYPDVFISEETGT
jgi:hypothetical protein